jgi:hypothetical protein
MQSVDEASTTLQSWETSMKRTATFATLILAASLSLPAFAYDRDGNPPGWHGGPGTNWENRPGPQGGPGTSPDRHHFARYDRDNNPPGHRGGPGTNWENPAGPVGGPGTSPDRH